MRERRERTQPADGRYVRGHGYYCRRRGARARWSRERGGGVGVVVAAAAVVVVVVVAVGCVVAVAEAAGAGAERAAHYRVAAAAVAGIRGRRQCR